MSGPAMGPVYNRKVKKLVNGDVVIPCAFAYVIRKIKEFDPATGTVKVMMTFIMRIKVTGYEDNDEVMTFLKEDLKLRVNEIEKSI